MQDTGPSSNTEMSMRDLVDALTDLRDALTLVSMALVDSITELDSSERAQAKAQADSHLARLRGQSRKPPAP